MDLFTRGLFVIGMTNLQIIQKFFNKEIFQKLGDISFYYFVVHWPIVISLTCMMTMVGYEKLGVNWVVSAIAAMIISIFLIGIISYFVERYIYAGLYKVEQFIVRKLTEK